MVIKREIAYGIVKGLSEFWNCEELQDFTVTVGEIQFACHKLLLAACSGFFRGLFRSGMKETIKNCAALEEISSETFKFILKAMYTGSDILTDDNVIDIWRAAHQLQITFMITECETFVLNSLSLENYIQYYQCGKLLCCEIVTEVIWKFILQHSDFFFKTSCFLELPLDDVLRLIKSQDLAANTEDEVLTAVINWVEYTPEKELLNDANCPHVQNKNAHTIILNEEKIKLSDKNSEEQYDGITTAMCVTENTTNNNNLMSCYKSTQREECVPSNKAVLCNATCDERKRYLFELVSNTRACLASHECLEMSLSNPLISETKQARDVLISAILYQFQIGKRNGQWPTWATHRNKSEYENVALTINKELQLMAYSFSKHNWSKYKPTTPFSKMILQMVTVDKSLYCFCVKYDNNGVVYSDFPFLVYRLTESNEWLLINNSLKLLITARFSVVAVGGCIYIVQLNKFWKLNPCLPALVPLCDLPDEKPICHLTCFDKTILAFHSVYMKGGVCETAVLSFNVTKNTWTKLKNIDGPAYGMTSFKDDHTFYLLQPNGDLWKIVKPQSGVVDFEVVAKLWRCNWPLHGAVMFLDELYLYGTKSERIDAELLRLKSVAGLFKKITYFQSPVPLCIKAMFVPFIVDKRLLVSIW